MKTAAARTFFTLWAMLCLGCSPVGASDVDGPAASKGEGLAKTREITEGSFRSLTIGESKDQVLAALRKMGATRIRPGLGEQVAVKRAEDLSKLQDAEGIRNAGVLPLGIERIQCAERAVEPAKLDQRQRDGKSRPPRVRRPGRHGVGGGQRLVVGTLRGVRVPQRDQDARVARRLRQGRLEEPLLRHRRRGDETLHVVLEGLQRERRHAGR